MKRTKVVWMFMLIILLAGCKSSGSMLEGTYRFVYPYNTDELIEDHYIVLNQEGDQIIGRYYGTSDDFDSAREGYLPGFFVLNMAELKIVDGEIVFKLEVNEEDLWLTPVALDCKTSQDASKSGNTRWDVFPLSGSRLYSGSISEEEIRLDVDGEQRVFEKIVK